MCLTAFTLGFFVECGGRLLLDSQSDFLAVLRFQLIKCKYFTYITFPANLLSAI